MFSFCFFFVSGIFSLDLNDTSVLTPIHKYVFDSTPHGMAEICLPTSYLSTTTERTDSGASGQDDSSSSESTESSCSRHGKPCSVCCKQLYSQYSMYYCTFLKADSKSIVYTLHFGNLCSTQPCCFPAIRVHSNSSPLDGFKSSLTHRDFFYSGVWA